MRAPGWLMMAGWRLAEEENREMEWSGWMDVLRGVHL